uniref:Tubulin tyrosine ligase-like family, member 7 n=1 Tax=Callorhinchus milii TaxID=7868 RepID=A0A4W3IDL2_CALMI
MPSFPSDRDDQGTSSPSLNTELPFQGTRHEKRNATMKKKNKGMITASFICTKYEIVRLAVDESGFTRIRDEDDTANLIWSDSAVQQEKIAELRNYQRINHFPGMGEICRKDCLARNMAKMIKSQAQEYSFTPRTWIFPAEYSQFQNCIKELKKKRRQKTFIVKPSNGAMGHGISLIRSGEKLQANEHLIVQEYLDKPFLMEGYKFDLRIYILVTSCDPLRIFLYNDGLVRMGTEKYHAPNDSNLSQLFMHLTNYSVNKHNENFERDENADRGSKRSIRWFTEFLQSNEYDVTKFWNDVSDLVVKTLIVAEPHVLHAYRMCRPGQPTGSSSVCFEVLGFDILLDRKLKPWLLEINRAPSFGTDQKIDFDVKKGVLIHTMKLLNIRASDKSKNLAQQKAEAQKRLYGQGCMKRLLAGSSEWEKQRYSLEMRREELKERLSQVRKQISREEHENRHLGNYRRIYPPDDKQLLEKYENLLAIAFQTFLAGRAASLQRELNNPLKHMKEEDILDLLEQCEMDDEKLLGKSPRQRGPKPLFSMPESTQPSTRKQKGDESSSRSSSCNSSSYSESDEEEKREKKVTYGAEEKFKSPERSSKTNEQEEELTKQSLISLNELTIRFPGKTVEESELLLDDILDNWKYHKSKVASYWLVKLDSIKQRKVLDIVRTNVRSILQRVWKIHDVDSLRLYRIFNRVFNRLLWSHGQGLWNCFSSSGTSWETIFSKSTEVITSQELQCCHRLVQLCKDCLLVVYRFAADSRGTFPTLNEWEESRLDYFTLLLFYEFTLYEYYIYTVTMMINYCNGGASLPNVQYKWKLSQ